MTVLRFQNKECEKLHGYIDAYLSNELLVETTHEVLKHIEHCANCKEALDSRQRVKASLRHAVRARQVPPGLETKLRARLREKSAASRLGWLSAPWIVAATCAALLIASGVAIQQRNQSASAKLLALGANDHIGCAIGNHHSPTPPDFAEVSGPERMGPSYGPLAPAIASQLGEFKFVDGHRCKVGGRTYPHLILERNGTLLSVSLLEKQPGENFPSGMLNGATKLNGMGIYQGRQESYSVAGFETAKHLIFVSSAFGDEENLALAGKIAAPTVDILKPLEARLTTPLQFLTLLLRPHSDFRNIQ